MSKYNVALIHPFDPRGSKVGGIETFVRDYIRYLPDDFNLLLIGVDGFSEDSIGKVQEIDFEGKAIKFLPILHVPEAETNLYASSLMKALTLRFTLAAVKHYAPIKKILTQGNYSIDLRRIELSYIARLFNRPNVQMLHDGMSKGYAMSSLLRRFWWVKSLSERFALHKAGYFFCVNADLTERLKSEHPRHAGKLDTLTTWANPKTFYPTPFPAGETLKVGYSGRMDAFKRPELMFALVARLRELNPRVEFHYIGDGDYGSVPGFSAIADVTVAHGKLNSKQVAQALSELHIGLLTSDFEGMPRSVMEFLSSGRPVVALHLPQLEAVIHSGVSGALVERGADEIDRMAHAIVDVHAAIQRGEITPDGVADAVRDYRPEVLLEKIYRAHRTMQGARSN